MNEYSIEIRLFKQNGMFTYGIEWFHYSKGSGEQEYCGWNKKEEAIEEAKQHIKEVIKDSLINSDVDFSDESIDREYNKYRINFQDLTEL